VKLNRLLNKKDPKDWWEANIKPVVEKALEYEWDQMEGDIDDAYEHFESVIENDLVAGDLVAQAQKMDPKGFNAWLQQTCYRVGIQLAKRHKAGDIKDIEVPVHKTPKDFEAGFSDDRNVDKYYKKLDKQIKKRQKAERRQQGKREF